MLWKLEDPVGPLIEIGHTVIGESHAVGREDVRRDGNPVCQICGSLGEVGFARVNLERKLESSIGPSAWRRQVNRR